MPPAQTSGTPEGPELVHQLRGRLGARVPAGARVHRDQPVHAAREALLGPLPLGHVVIDDAAERLAPLRTTQRGLPSEVTKKRTPSSSATFTQRIIRSW